MRKIEVKVQYSGGKDSQASLIYAVKEYGVLNVEAVFCDTAWEHPVTYKHIIDTCKQLGVKLRIIKSKKYDGFVDLAKRKKRFPSTMARFCTEELKAKPFIDYVLDECKDILVLQGIRGEESASRAKMKIQCTVFKYYLEPYKSNQITIDELGSKKNLSLVQKRKLKLAIERLSQGKNDEKYFTYRRDEVLSFVSKYADDILRPHFDKSGQYVIDYIIKNGQKPNPLYYKGSSRVGCYPCVMSGHNEVYEIIIRDPWRIDEIIEIENQTGRTFFPPGYIPDRFCSGLDKNGKSFPYMIDVVKYITEKRATGNLFEPDPKTSCSSFFHLCE